MLKRMNSFNKFDHAEFLKGKRLAIAKVEEKFEYDEKKREYTDKLSHINVGVDIVTDDYVYSEGTQYEEIGVNAGERINVKVVRDGATADEFLKMMGDGFNRYQVELFGITSARVDEKPVGERSENGYQRKDVNLYIEGDIRVKDAK